MAACQNDRSIQTLSSYLGHSGMQADNVYM
jgi:hypothetical protein